MDTGVDEYLQLKMSFRKLGKSMLRKIVLVLVLCLASVSAYAKEESCFSHSIHREGLVNTGGNFPEFAQRCGNGGGARTRPRKTVSPVRDKPQAVCVKIKKSVNRLLDTEEYLKSKFSNNAGHLKKFRLENKKLLSRLKDSRNKSEDLNAKFKSDGSGWYSRWFGMMNSARFTNALINKNNARIKTILLEQGHYNRKIGEVRRTINARLRSFSQRCVKHKNDGRIVDWICRNFKRLCKKK